MPECPIRAPFSALPRFMPQNISSKSFFFQQAKVFCQTKSNKKKKKERKTEPEEHLQMLQMSKKCCKYRSGKVVEQNCENWNENYPLWLWQQHFNLSCHFARASCSTLHLPLSILDNLKKPPPLHFIHVAPFDFISYFLLNLCCRSAVEEEAG